jgi:hypothetical protein
LIRKEKSPITAHNGNNMTINRHGGTVEVIKKESMIGVKHIVSVKSEERLYALIFDDEASPHGVIFLCYFVFNLIVTCMTLTKPIQSAPEREPNIEISQSRQYTHRGMFRSHPNWCHEKTGIPYNQNKYV